MSIQMLVLLVPVMFGLMGFAIDLGRLYLIRGELTQAAQSMATAAASRLIGTEQALADATTAARLTLEDSAGHGNKYNFGSLLIGGSTGVPGQRSIRSDLFLDRGGRDRRGRGLVRFRRRGRPGRQVRADQRKRRCAAAVLGPALARPGAGQPSRHGRWPESARRCAPPAASSRLPSPRFPRTTPSISASLPV